MTAFSTPITVQDGTRIGPARQPAQMLANQTYDGHSSVHDDETAAKLGLAGAPIEGPTHFSQIDPLAYDLWGRQWFETGCISSHFRTMVVEGESVVASLADPIESVAEITAEKEDGTPVLAGTASVDPNATTALRRRLADMRAREPGDLYVIDRLRVGDRVTIDEPQIVEMEDWNGPMYPFSLRQKLDRITEPTSWYETADNPWGRPIVPFEMYSVLTNKTRGMPGVRSPANGLFIDLEVQAVDGPMFVGEPYLIEKELLCVGQSRRVESYWSESRVREAGSGRHVATVLLHQGVFKDSYPGYPSG